MMGFTSSSKALGGGQSCPYCPSSDAYFVYADGHAHCYSCGHHQHSERTLESLKSSLEDSKKPQNYVQLPSDFDQYIPDRAEDWLGKYQLNRKERSRHTIGFSEKKDSLIFPIFGPFGGDPILYQSRYFGVDPKQPKWRTVGSAENVLHLPNEYEDGTIVVVEDIISSIKVSRVTNCVALFGSTLTTGMMIRLSKLFKRARVWLDPDARRKGLRQALCLQEVGLPATCIFSNYDPKDYHTADIRRIVESKEFAG